MASAIKEDTLQSFVLNGYLVVPPSATIPEDFHLGVYKRTEDACAKAGHTPPKEPNVQRELWRSADMDRVLSTPEMTEALGAILGPSYVVYPHRHMHTCSPLAGQEWHQDPSIFPIRSARCRSVLAMYYPGDVALEDGPTGFLPGSPYMCLDGPADAEWDSGTQDVVPGHQQKMIECFMRKRDGVAFEAEVNESAARFDNSGASACLPPQPSHGVLKGGSFIINHYEIIHRGTCRLPGGKFRPMYKFLILRSSVPAQMPDFSATLPNSEELAGKATPGQMALWQCIWEWLTAAKDAPTAGAEVDVASVSASFLSGQAPYMALLGSTFLLARAARSGAQGALEALFEGLNGGGAEKACRQRVRKAAAMALVEVGQAAAAGALAELLKPMPPAGEVEGLLVRIAATYALGEIAAVCAPDVVQQISAALLEQLRATVPLLPAPGSRGKAAKGDDEESWVGMIASFFGWGDRPAKGSGGEAPASKAGVSGEQAAAAWAVLEASGESWVNQKMKAKFDADPPTFIEGLRNKFPDLHQRVVAAMGEGQAQPAAKKGPSSEEQAAAAWAVLEASGESWVNQKIKATFDKDPPTFIEGLRSKFPDLHQRVVAAMGGDQAKGRPGEFGRATKQLVLTTCFALGCVGQAVAGTDLVAEFLAQLQEASSVVGQAVPLQQNQHSPFPPNLLALAAVSACTAPGTSREARVTADTPPQTVTDRNACVFLALALCRWQASGKAQDGGDDKVTGVLRAMIADQEALLRRPARKGKDPSYEDEVFPKLFAGDVGPFYHV